MTKVINPKKLIDVSLPLDEINIASGREKSIRHGHPSTLHMWWARRPLAAARAVIFAQMVNDPSETIQGDKRLRETQLKIQHEREKLFEIIRELVKWENTNNEEVLNKARKAIKDSWRFTCELNKKHPQANELFNPEKLPGFHDPFAGGGAIPLEAQRLGLESYATDLNPVPVMINKSMIELPFPFAGKSPVGPASDDIKQQRLIDSYSGTQGLAEDVRRFGHILYKNVSKKLEHLYPKIEGKNVIAWIWARSAKCPNPACGVMTPLVKSFQISKTKAKSVWIKPELETNGGKKYFKYSISSSGDGIPDCTVSRKGAVCLCCENPIGFDYIREQSKQGLLEDQLVAIVGESSRSREYYSPTQEHFEAALSSNEQHGLHSTIDHWAGCTNVVIYGLDTFEKLFTTRQTETITTFLDETRELHEEIKKHAQAISDVEKECDQYAKAIITYLTFATTRLTQYWSNQSTWHNAGAKMQGVFGRQAISMAWDYAEANPFSNSTGNWLGSLEWVAKSVAELNNSAQGYSFQLDAMQTSTLKNVVVSTDPPYYDNIPYSNLSDFFYMWMRYGLKSEFPDVFGTMQVPKKEELVANRFRHGGKDNAESFFLEGMKKAILNMAAESHPSFPITIYYAFKQAETTDSGTSSTGWETFLQAVIDQGLEISGTWPLRTEMTARALGRKGMNLLASSVVLVCNKRDLTVSSVSRRQFQKELREKMPDSLEAMIGGSEGASPIAPVDLAQAAIGPGMAIFSKYEAVLNQDGSKMTVHDALILINRAITDYLNPDSGNFDNDTLFCDDWFSQYGWGQGQFGEADTLARAKGTSVDGVRDAGVIESGGGKVRLLKWSEYPTDWDPKTDTRTPVWEACHQMIRVLNQQGEAEAGALLARMPERGEHIRQLAYHLYTLCERKKWAEEARAYNELIGSWHAIVAASHEVGHSNEQIGMDI